MNDIKIAIFGLGQAGSLIAADLVSAGVEVSAFDPGSADTPEGIKRAQSPAAAVAGADLVLAATAPSRSPAALSQAIDSIPAGAVYADISTGSPKLKRGLALTAERQDLMFAGVALLSIVPGVGLSAPSLVSGSGADRYQELLAPLGANVEVVGDDPGLAASRKFLRAIMIRGVAALGVEALLAGHAADDVAWLWDNLTVELRDGGDDWLAQTVANLGPFASRRRKEMESCPLHLKDLGVDPIMTTATIEMLRRVEQSGLPPIPGQ